MARIAARDQDAFGALYDRHCRLVYGLALHILTQQSEAETVVEHVFLAVWKHAERYAALDSPAVWLVQATRRRAIERLRALGAHTGNRAPASAESSVIGCALDMLSGEQRMLIEQVSLIRFGGRFSYAA